MNMLTAIAAVLGTTARHWSGFPIQRHQAPPKPRYGSVKKQQRAAAKARARKRARRLGQA